MTRWACSYLPNNYTTYIFVTKQPNVYANGHLHRYIYLGYMYMYELGKSVHAQCTEVVWTAMSYVT